MQKSLKPGWTQKLMTGLAAHRAGKKEKNQQAAPAAPAPLKPPSTRTSTDDIGVSSATPLKIEFLIRNLSARPHTQICDKDRMENVLEHAAVVISAGEKDITQSIHAHIDRRLQQLPDTITSALASKVKGDLKKECEDIVKAGEATLHKALRDDGVADYLLRPEFKVPRSQLYKTIKDVKKRLTGGLDNTLAQRGMSNNWYPTPPEAGGVEWTNESGPVLQKRGLDWKGLQATGEELGTGGFGSVVGFTTANGSKLAGKVIHPMHQAIDWLQMELDAYNKVYTLAGPHPNVCNVYGIAHVEINGEPERVLLMDHVPGMDGEDFIHALRDCMETGSISFTEFINVSKFYLKKSLEGSQHLSKAGVVHNDFKPPNIRVAENGTPVLMDFNVAGSFGSRMMVGTEDYMSKDYRKGVNETTDVFCIGGMTIEMFEGWDRRIPRQRLRKFSDMLGDRINLLRGRPRSLKVDWIAPKAGPARGTLYQFDTRGGFKVIRANEIRSEYLDFVQWMLEKNPKHRPTAAQALDHPFLKDEVDEEAAVKTIARVMEYERAKKTTPPQEQSEGRSMSEEAAMESERQPVRKQPMDVISDMPMPLREKVLDFQRNPQLARYTELKEASIDEPALAECLQIPEFWKPLARPLRNEAIEKSAKLLERYGGVFDAVADALQSLGESDQVNTRALIDNGKASGWQEKSEGLVQQLSNSEEALKVYLHEFNSVYHWLAMDEPMDKTASRQEIRNACAVQRRAQELLARHEAPGSIARNALEMLERCRNGEIDSRIAARSAGLKPQPRTNDLPPADQQPRVAPGRQALRSMEQRSEKLKPLLEKTFNEIKKGSGNNPPDTDK
ncbi:protein kinase domain-containing protein [Noviherbaspirillum aerium]|uniref:protein kinase domain-containing protein n=1 Tax=Noviherbaspirillum aerium TaxID=2588497 RepID=UPI00178C584C|nr:hypothetical protein [Noviherbaspirillum aerium]